MEFLKYMVEIREIYDKIKDAESFKKGKGGFEIFQIYSLFNELIDDSGFKELPKATTDKISNCYRLICNIASGETHFPEVSAETVLSKAEIRKKGGTDKITPGYLLDVVDKEIETLRILTAFP